jgi:hypothetical protein
MDIQIGNLRENLGLKASKREMETTTIRRSWVYTGGTLPSHGTCMLYKQYFFAR